MTRSIPPSLAGVVELLELDRRVTITTEELTALIDRAGAASPARVVINRLAERGWLLKTGVRGVWEFAPGEHAGPYSKSGSWTTLRAALSKDPAMPVGVALGSALWLMDLADRAPDIHELALPQAIHIPAALQRAYRVVRFDAHLPPNQIQGLFVHRPATVLAHIAHRPSAVRSWSSVMAALAELVEASSLDDLKTELGGRPHSTSVRLAYLTQGVAPNLAEELRIVPGHKVWFGPRGRLRHHDATWNVADTVLPYHPAELADTQ